MDATPHSTRHGVGRDEVSAARSLTFTRRRRSLAVLAVGSLGACLLALVVSGLLIVIGAIAFILCLGGYLNFLRTQARRERERHEHRRSSRSTQ
jgi:hypothetical protein